MEWMQGVLDFWVIIGIVIWVCIHKLRNPQRMRFYKKLGKIAKEYAEENNCFWGDENNYFIDRITFFHKDYLVYNKRSVMESDYSVTIQKKTLKPYKISPFGNQKPNAKNSTKNYEN